MERVELISEKVSVLVLSFSRGLSSWRSTWLSPSYYSAALSPCVTCGELWNLQKTIPLGIKFQHMNMGGATDCQTLGIPNTSISQHGFPGYVYAWHCFWLYARSWEFVLIEYRHFCISMTPIGLFWDTFVWRELNGLAKQGSLLVKAFSSPPRSLSPALWIRTFPTPAWKKQPVLGVFHVLWAQLLLIFSAGSSLDLEWFPHVCTQVCALWQVGGSSLSSPSPFFLLPESNILEHGLLALNLRVPWDLIVFLLCGLDIFRIQLGRLASASSSFLCLWNHYPLVTHVCYLKTQCYVCLSFVTSSISEARRRHDWLLVVMLCDLSMGWNLTLQGDNSGRWVGPLQPDEIVIYDRHSPEWKAQERSLTVFPMRTQKYPLRQGEESLHQPFSLTHLRLEVPSIKNRENAFFLLISNGGSVTAAETNWDTLWLLTKAWGLNNRAL